MKLKKEVKFVLICLIVTFALFWVFKPKSEKRTKNNTPTESNGGVTPVEEVKDKKMSIVMVGDALIHGAVYLDAARGNGTYDFSPIFTSISPIIQKYDLRYYNQESIIGGGTPQHYPRLNSPDEIGKDLVAAGFNLVSLANNHSFDKDEPGLVHSIEFWKSQTGVITAGQYSSFEEQREVPIYEQNGIKYAFLSYTTVTNGLSAPRGKEYYVNVYDEETVKEDVEKARSKGAEVIIVAMHWGEEYTHTPVAEEYNVANYLSSLGVNLVIGAHPHVIQPIAYVGDTLVIYSLGNFISAQHPLGLEKIIGLLVGVEIVVDKDGKVKFDNLDYQLLYTYCEPGYHNFKVLPFSELNDTILPNYQSINEQYLAIVKREGL